MIWWTEEKLGVEERSKFKDLTQGPNLQFIPYLECVSLLRHVINTTTANVFFSRLLWGSMCECALETEKYYPHIIISINHDGLNLMS